MSEFLYNLGTIIDQQFNLSDNKQNTLDLIEDGKVTRYGKLGTFASKFDQSAQRKYYEEGFTKHSMSPKVFQVLSQEPDVTVVIKKKEFSSLKENNKPQYQDKEDKLFIRAASILFRNKCSQIAMYERLTKIERIAKLQKNIDYGLLPILLDTFDAASAIPGFSNLFNNKFKTAMETVRKLMAYNRPAFWTTWTEDPNRLFKSSYGTGTGVIELTTVSSINTNTSVHWGGGSCNFTVEDPYRLMTITESDIELAISDAINPFKRSQFVNVAKDTTRAIIDKNKNLLNLKRRRRQVNEINFIVNPDTYLGKRIRVLIDGIGYEININTSANLDFGGGDVGDFFSDVGDLLSGNLKKEFDPAANFGSEELGNQGLKDDEKELISSIIDSITSLISLDSNTRTQAKKTAKETNKLRKKLMLHYCNNSIIQPMDVVHVFMDSKSKVDNKIVGGLQSSFTGFGFLQNLSQQVNDLSQQFKTIFNPSNASVEIEKSIFVGKDFPSYLWSIMRNQFVTDKAGTHVFAGLVDIPETSISPGKCTISVSCKDNTQFFHLGQVNINPSIENANGPLMDPVTPFDINIDSITGTQKEAPQLLDENKKFYAQALPKYMAGAHAGKTATQANFEHQDSDVGFALPSGSQPNVVQNIFYPPEGTVYRWKEGIGTLTLSRNTYGNGFNTSIPAQNIPRATTEEAFAGQDIMNVISLLITGQPYNFATFYKTILQTDQFKQDFFNDPSFFRNLQKDLEKNNKLWGDFQPFKKLIMSDASFAQIMNGTLSVVAANTKLEELLQQRAETYDRLAIAGAGFIDGSQTNLSQLNSTESSSRRLKELNDQISQAQNDLSKSLESGSKFYQLFGDDISFDVDSFTKSEDRKNILHNPSVRKELRRKINFLTRRLFYRVKANEDSNLFIVDDSYDKDLELQAFSKAIGNKFPLFLNEYDSVAHQIQTVAEKLDLEVFADSQGHIQARPPQFNRVPNSVFLRLLRNKEDRGIQIFPQFLQDLYSNQLQSFFRNIEIVEDQIRLYAAAISVETDDRIITDLITDSDAAHKFEFLSDPDTGEINDLNIASAIANPDENNLERIEEVADTVETQAREVRFAFTNKARSTLLVNRFTLDSARNPIPVFDDNNPTLTTRVNTVSDNLRRKTGIRPESIKKLFLNDGKLNVTGASALDVLRITKQIASLVSERQRLVKSASGALAAVRDALRTTVNADKIGSTTISKLAFPNLYNQEGVPEILEHMIEDESYDDYGPGSGRRYIVRDHQILSMRFRESPPEFNFIQVNGLFGGTEGFFGEGEGPEGLNLERGGNAQTTAYAVDYDMWRMYGFRMGQSLQINALSDPETQLAPYAVSLLNRARAQIKTASATIAGNEYMQAGEVIYIEPTNMLWYVDSVSHSFSFGGSFTTSLNLTYGHNPGEYIPTAFDIVGKVLYKNRDNTNHVVLKDENAFNEKPISALSFEQALFGFEDPVNGFRGKDGKNLSNVNTLQNIQYSLLGIINPNSTVSTAPKIEIRTYYYSKDTSGSTSSPSGYISKYAEFIRQILIGGAGTKEMTELFGKDAPPKLPKEQVKEVQKIDLSDSSEHRSPSAKAWELARALSSESGSTDSVKGIKSKIVGGVIDIWLTFEES